MKKKLLFLLPLVLGLSVPVLFKANNTYQKAEAYSINSLPTTINLNDTNSDDIRNYYSSLDSLNESERKGTNLLKNLKPILKQNQTYYSYESGTKVWQAYEITDRDWIKSPVNDIEGYDPVTNTITGYKYGSKADNPGSNPYIHALYINRDVDNNVRAWANDAGESSHGGNKEWNIDREHIWPKSFGFEDEATAGARGDLMHLWAGDSYVNSALHSNYFYGYVDTTRKYTDGGAKYTEVSGNLMGFSKTVGGNITVFEPQDSDKGDIARSVFYMMARYNYLSGSDSDGIDSNNPNLEIVNSLDYFSESGYMSSTTQTGKIGLIQDLLEWNKLDPVDEYEIHRNNLLFNNYTNNRNPFIDFPEWADVVWGDSTIAASPATDKINDSGAALTISKSSVTVKPNETFKIKASVSESVSITWSVSDSTILSLDKTSTANNEEVTVTALKEGNATIEASVVIDETTYKKECKVVVSNKESGKGETSGGFNLVEFMKSLPMPALIAIIVVAAAIIVVVIIILAKSNKARKYAKKTAKKVVKKQNKKKK